MQRCKKCSRKQRFRLRHIMILLFALLLNGFLCARAWDKAGDVTESMGDHRSSAEELVGTTLYLQMTREELQQGDLVLVNYEYGYDPNNADKLVCVYENMNHTYYVKQVDLQFCERALVSLNQWLEDYFNETGEGNINIVAGYRTSADQQALYDNALNLYGADYAADYFNTPGHSEHHTGLAVDFAIWDPVNQMAGDFTGDGKETWLLENAWRYGYIQRYPPEKQSVTGIAYESWHFRYVGVPHAWYMYQHDLVLEEYLALLRQHPFEDPLCFVAGGKTYQVYFCQGFSVPLPNRENFEISGNNIDGFIVTFIVS